MEVGRGSGVVVARVCWCCRLDLSLMLPAPGNSRVLKRCSSAHWSQLEARPVPVCLDTRQHRYMFTEEKDWLIVSP